MPVLELDAGDVHPGVRRDPAVPGGGHAVPARPPARPCARAPVAVLRAEPGRAGAGGGAVHGADRARRSAGGVRRPARARGARVAESLARGLADGRPFLAGDATASPTSRSTRTCTARARRARAGEYRRIAAWVGRVEATPGFVNDLAPIPWTGSGRPFRPGGSIGRGSNGWRWRLGVAVARLAFPLTGPRNLVEPIDRFCRAGWATRRSSTSTRVSGTPRVLARLDGALTGASSARRRRSPRVRGARI